MKYLSPMCGFTLLSIACLTIMVGCVVLPGLPQIALNLSVGENSSLLVTLPSLGVIILGPGIAKVINRVGLLNSLRIGLFLYGLLGSVIPYLPGKNLIYIDRFFLGGATALVMTSGTGLISVLYQGTQRLKMISIQGMTIEFGGVIFLSISGLLVSLKWSYPFYLYLVAWVLLILVEIYIPRKIPIHNSDVHYEKAPKIRYVYILAFLSLLIFFSNIIELPYKLILNSFNEIFVGYYLSYCSLMAVAAAALMPKCIRTFSEMNTLKIGFFCYFIAQAIFISYSSVAFMFLAGFFLGFGFGLTVPLLNHITIEKTSINQRNKCLTFLSMAIFLGQFSSSVLDFFLKIYTRIFLVTIIVAVLAIALVIWHQYKTRIIY